VRWLNPHAKQWAHNKLIFDDNLFVKSFGVTGPDFREYFVCIQGSQLLINVFIVALLQQGR
jgi:hypothetical protein